MSPARRREVSAPGVRMLPALEERELGRYSIFHSLHTHCTPTEGHALCEKLGVPGGTSPTLPCLHRAGHVAQTANIPRRPHGAFGHYWNLRYPGKHSAPQAGTRGPNLGQGRGAAGKERIEVGHGGSKEGKGFWAGRGAQCGAQACCFGIPEEGPCGHSVGSTKGSEGSEKRLEPDPFPPPKT